MCIGKAKNKRDFTFINTTKKKKKKVRNQKANETKNKFVVVMHMYVCMFFEYTACMRM